MIPFICGTYHGLFVQTEFPSVFPGDISYFDFRVRGARCIPADQNPNLVIRFNISARSPMIMVSLVYEAVEGTRKGFVGFGCLIFEKDFNDRSIQNGILKAIELAQNSKSYFDGRRLSGRPESTEGRQLDLTELPLSDKSELFGRLALNIHESGAITQVTSLILDAINQPWENFELVVNSNGGMTREVLIEELNRQFNLIIHQKLQAEKKRLHEENKRKLDEELKRKQELSKKEQKHFLFQIATYGISIISLAALSIFVLVMLFKEDEQTKHDDAAQVVLQSVAQRENKNNNKPTEIAPTALIDALSCNIDDLSEEDLKLSKVITDLPNLSHCLQLSEQLQGRLLENKRIPKLIYTDNSSFNILSNSLSEKEWRVTSFKNVMSNTNLSGMLFINQDGKLDLAFPELSIGVSFQEAIPQFFCKNAFPAGAYAPEISFFYFTTAENEYRTQFRFFAHGVLLLVEKIYGEFYETNGGEDMDLSGKLMKLRRIKPPGTTPTIKPYLTSDNKLADNSCIVTIDEHDANVLQDKLKENEITAKRLSIAAFIEEQLLQFEVNEEAKIEIPELGCNKLPELFVFGKELQPSKYVINEVQRLEDTSNAIGQFDFFPQLARQYDDKIQLPQSLKFNNIFGVFDELRSVYKDENLDHNLFDEDGYDPEELCFTR
jgi:hypothetical protein